MVVMHVERRSEDPGEGTRDKMKSAMSKRKEMAKARVIHL